MGPSNGAGCGAIQRGPSNGESDFGGLLVGGPGDLPRVRPESQPRASRTNRCSARRRTPRSETCAGPPRPAPGLKGRFQRSQVRKHLVATPLNTPAGLKGRFQQSEVRKHLGEPYPTATTADVLKSALQASKPIWGCPGPRAAPWAFGNRPFRPVSQTRAEQNETVAPGDRLVSWVMTRAEAEATVGRLWGHPTEMQAVPVWR